MNKGLVLAVAVLAALALSVWFFSSSAPSAAEPETATSTSPTPTAKAPEPKAPVKSPETKGVPNPQPSYKSLLTQTGSYQCDYSSVTAEGQTMSVIYLYGGKMRGEFRTVSPGQSESNLFVYDGQYLYQWEEGKSVGVKTVLTSLSQLPLVIPKDLTSGAIVGSSYESVGWHCHSWLTNKSLLTPPSYVTFR
jgi:hypothetical protein